MVVVFRFLFRWSFYLALALASATVTLSVLSLHVPTYHSSVTSGHAVPARADLVAYTDYVHTVEADIGLLDTTAGRTAALTDGAYVCYWHGQGVDGLFLETSIVDDYAPAQQTYTARQHVHALYMDAVSILCP
jgi:hypothetical protein